jgi:peroxiredoxin
MNKSPALLLAAALLALIATAGFAAGASVGSPAPDFTLPDIHGTTHSLSDFAGKVVVLEWTNRDCPFVKKHYEPGNMQSLQAKYTSQGAVWLSICSSAPGKQGHFSAEDWKQIVADQNIRSTAVLLDPAGDVGRAYEAKTTPHLFVIGTDGTLLYDGAIDDKPSTNSADIPGARPYLAEALDAALAGDPVAVSKTTPYGCSVKY